MPGDKKEGKATIKNTTKDDIEIFFKTEQFSKNESYDEIDDSLLQKIKLRIKLKTQNKEKDIYNGNLGAESISKSYISLGKYVKNFDGEFLFEIEVPKELNNTYTLSKTEVKWIFYVKKEDSSENPNTDNNINNTTDNKVDPNSNSNSNSTNTNIAEKDKDKQKTNIIENFKNIIKTGDISFYIISLIILIIIVNIIIEVRRKIKNEKK